MPVNTIEIPKDLRNLIDASILDDPNHEHGGLVFGSPIRFDAFLPVPNVHPDRRHKYKMPENWQRFSKEFERVVGSELVAQVHTHPSHSIPSEQDVRSGNYWFQYVRYAILIAPNAEAAKTTWWILDKRHEVQELVETDETLETAALMFARRFGYANLGPVLMDESGNLKAQGRIPQALIDNPDARHLYAVMLGHKGHLETKKQLQQMSGLSGNRVQAAIQVLWAADLLEETIRYRELFRVRNIFGRRFG